MLYSKDGCQTCKSRRIKCDEVKPVCHRCAKSRRVCLRTRPVKQAYVAIHVENPYASGQTKRPRGPRARPRSSLTMFRPTLNVPSQAVTYYLNYYLCALADLPTVSACMSECLTAWKASNRESSIVNLAISALALAIFSRTQKHPQAAREAVSRYSRLLRLAHEQITQVEIKRCDDEGFDEFLLTIVLMAWYETTMHEPESMKQKNLLSSLHSWSHHDGAMAILKVWSGRLRKNAPSSIVQHSRRGLLRSALLRNHSLPNWVQDGSRFGERSLDLRFDALLVRVVNLRYAFKSFEQNKYPETTEAKDLFDESRALDEACLDWVAKIPSEWSYQSCGIPKSWPRSEFYSAYVYVYGQHGYAAVWIQYFALRMIISSTLLSLLQLNRLPGLQTYNSAYHQQHLKYKTHLGAMADKIASTIPFSLGRVTANNAAPPDSQPKLALNLGEDITPALGLPTIWPLSMASSLDGVHPSQKLWFRAQLARLGHVLGDGALVCAGTDQWTHN